MDGSERLLASKASVFIAVMLLSSSMFAQSLYKYKDADGEWVYTDRRPPDGQTAEIRKLPVETKAPAIRFDTQFVGRSVRFYAHNDYALPVEVALQLTKITNLDYPAPDHPMRWTVPANSTLQLIELDAPDDSIAPQVEYRFQWLPGDPTANHNEQELYRAPFSVATEYPITQYFPIGVTHLAPDSYYAIDLAMPVGTDIFAARGGTVFEVASTNFSGGLDPERDMQTANIVRVVHDDGSHAVYAHLNWNSIRVQVGDRVRRGQFIAESGNTGFSSGPHLHFAVVVNRGMQLVSVPIFFEGPNASTIEPVTGEQLSAY